jgi:hypothetical protein
MVTELFALILSNVMRVSDTHWLYEAEIIAAK